MCARYPAGGAHAPLGPDKKKVSAADSRIQEAHAVQVTSAKKCLTSVS